MFNQHRRCVCLDRGLVNSGLRGVLAGPIRGGARIIERCDACETYPSDETAALAYSSVFSGSCRYSADLRVLWFPE